MKEKIIKTYGCYERLHNYILVGIMAYILLLVILLVTSLLFISSRKVDIVYFFGLCMFFYILIIFIFAFLFYYLSTKQVVFKGEKITIVGIIGRKKTVNINKIRDILVGKDPDIFAQMKRNKDTYYGLYFKLENGENLIVSENLHITTLYRFFKEFLKYYGNKLPDDCLNRIRTFMKEKENIWKKFIFECRSNVKIEGGDR